MMASNSMMTTLLMTGCAVTVDRGLPVATLHERRAEKMFEAGRVAEAMATDGAHDWTHLGRVLINARAIFEADASALGLRAAFHMLAKRYGRA